MNNFLNSKNLILIGVFAVILIGGYFLLANRGAAPQVNTDDLRNEAEQEVDEVAGDEDTMTVALSAQNDSGQDGTATLTEEDGKVMVEIEVESSDEGEGIAQPAHIHMGACPEPGEIAYPLTNVVDGESETTLDVTLAELKEQLPLAINVHKSAAEISVYTSCGDLE